MMPTRKPAGFTLVEMLVIISILAILAAMAAPSFNSLFDSSRVKRAAETASAFLVNAKSQSIKMNRNVAAVVSGSGTSWCIGMVEMVDDDTTCDCATAGSCQIEGVDRVLDGAIFKGVELNGPDDGHAFEFRPLRKTVSGNETIELASEDGVAFHIVVSPVGRVRICAVGGSRGGYPAC
jgi:type IV fimbrial biogenesis protein FimT